MQAIVEDLEASGASESEINEAVETYVTEAIEEYIASVSSVEESSDELETAPSTETVEAL